MMRLTAQRSLFSSRTQARLPRRSANCRHHGPAVICSATPEKEKTKVDVPDTPPAPSSPPQPASSTQQPATQSQDGMSVEDIQQRAAQLRAAKEQQQQQLQQPGKDSFLQGVVEEVFLIKWPSPRQAILNTLLVIVIVAGTSALLFAVNTALAELSRQIYG